MHSISYLLAGRFSAQKVGGLVFIKVRYWGCNKLCVSWCITQK